MKNDQYHILFLILIGFIMILVILNVINLTIKYSLSLTLGDIGLIASLAVATLGLVFNGLSVREDTRVRKMQAFNNIVEEWDKSKQDQWHILKKSECGPEDNEKISKVLNICQRISFMAQSELISEQDVADFIGGRMLTIWIKLENYVRNVIRKEKGQSNVSYVFFECFAENTLAKYWKLGSDERLVYIGDGKIKALLARKAP